MDGRDLARCIATEETQGVEAFTVSTENAAIYSHNKHYQGSFNNRKFVEYMMEQFGENIKFHQITLDYFYCPSFWVAEHWKKVFFRDQLPLLLEILDETDAPTEAPVGIYLPFVLYIVKELVALSQEHKNLYKIEFLSAQELSQNFLWSGTQTICAATMQGILGKEINQEYTYCTFQRGAFSANGNNNHAINKLLDTIRDFAQIRMIRLTPIPTSAAWKASLKLLQQFKKREGHCSVPRTHVEGDYTLGEWVQHQRSRNDLTGKQIKALNTINFQWNVLRSWNERFIELTRFKKKFGHCKVVRPYIVGGSCLGNWVRNQRYEAKKKKNYSTPRRLKLDKLGFIW